MTKSLWLAAKGENASVREITEGDLLGDSGTARVRIRVEYSDINYKDALAVTGAPGIVREFPLVPGIDAIGVVEDDPTGTFTAGDRVAGIGGGLGENVNGGYSEIAFIDAALLTKIPERFDNKTAAAIGTAGFTAALCVNRLLEHGIEPGSEVWVTGATGGVGSVAISLLANLGFAPVAISSKIDSAADYLKTLGASRVVDAGEFKEAGRPLQSANIPSAIDTLGSVPLANLLARIVPGGIVASCGLAAGGNLPTSVMPFILRSVTLAGINSVYPLPGWREAAWNLLDRALDAEKLLEATRTVSLDEVADASKTLLEGTNKGRYIVKL